MLLLAIASSIHVLGSPASTGPNGLLFLLKSITHIFKVKLEKLLLKSVTLPEVFSQLRFGQVKLIMFFGLYTIQTFGWHPARFKVSGILNRNVVKCQISGNRAQSEFLSNFIIEESFFGFPLRVFSLSKVSQTWTSVYFSNIQSKSKHNL